MHKAFPAHHRKHIDQMLKAARADLTRRGIDAADRSALQVFALRAIERGKDRSLAVAAKLARASRAAATSAGRVRRITAGRVAVPARMPPPPARQLPR